ncbi:hypothetical protein [Campylobacter ureolyticus]|uniref:hypothetical protein n=1 Tax=Campylobacter ureolyticus TaxID=827 RepID=UPI0022B43E1D|nr:hypothetical protein [Campylobacter ureolyticus]MCZ6174538.1 hypothetical protein [Campylobacter ureolyticus]
MSDDKREKLREYLRNNRPKNRVNLGNSSNNKENSNKNLDNLNNSSVLKDQNSAQISNSKTNSNKRDYDEEPLVLKSYSTFLFYQIPLILLISASVFFLCVGKILIFFSILIFVIIATIILYCYINIYNKYEIKFYKTRIEFTKNNNVFDIYEVNKGEMKEQFSFKKPKDIIVFFLILFFLLAIDTEYPLYALIPIFTILSVHFYQILLFYTIYFINNKTFKNFWKFRKIMSIAIDFYDIGELFYHFGKGFKFRIFSYKDYRSLRIYFLMNFGFDINKK